MRDAHLHRAGRGAQAAMAAGLPALTLCGRVLAVGGWSINGAAPGAPACPRCEAIARRKRWAPYGRR